MCGRMGLSITKVEQLYSRFEITNTLPSYRPHYNIPPSSLYPIITKHSPNKVQFMLWGLIPFYSQDKKNVYATINARSEGIENKPTFKKPFRLQRCLVPATHFFEWDKKQKPSIPYLFKLKSDELFAFAGLYDIWDDPESSKEIFSFTIITCSANSLVDKIHPRMPVILKKEDEEEWLNPDTTEPEKLLPLLKPFPAESMTAYRVPYVINNPKYDSPFVVKSEKDTLIQQKILDENIDLNPK